MVALLAQALVKLERSVSEKVGQEEIEVVVTRGPETAEPFSDPEEIDRLVNHALTFHNEIVGLFDLGEGLPPIVAFRGERPISNGLCDYHEEHRKEAFTRSLSLCCGKVRLRGKPYKTGYGVGSNSFGTLGEALGYALALRDRENPNDASYTARCINRLLVGGDWR